MWNISNNELYITREYNTSPQLMFNVWTHAEMIARWWIPEEFIILRCTVVAEEGGEINIKLRGPDGVATGFTGKFLELETPERLTFSAKTAMPVCKDLFLENIHTVIFTGSLGKTRVTLQLVVTRSADDNNKTMLMLAECWNKSLNRLESFINTKPLYKTA